MPEWAQKQGFADDELALKGAKLFAQAGCLNCHTYLGAGISNVGAPDLSSIGATRARTSRTSSATSPTRPSSATR